MDGIWRRFCSPAEENRARRRERLLARIVDGFTTAVTGFDGATVLRRRTYTETGITYADTDVRGNVFTSVCDIAGRIISGTDAAGNTTTYAYGQPFDLPTCVTNALGKTACSFYDIRGRKEAEWGQPYSPPYMLMTPPAIW